MDWKSQSLPAVCLLLLGSCMVGSQSMPDSPSAVVGCATLPPLKAGLAAAFEAATLAQEAATLAAWHQVAWRLLRDVLTPAQLPRLILWVEGVRSLNSSRPDSTLD
ncbi:hypothetical protein [Spirulina major]|uniref:hypothetical protein n=1 Tax=Spirulina major TaxID=270636 RepID=UPI0011149AB7|nr:hypothetical protein [Spirulina major]